MKTHVNFHPVLRPSSKPNGMSKVNAVTITYLGDSLTFEQASLRRRDVVHGESFYSSVNALLLQLDEDQSTKMWFAFVKISELDNHKASSIDAIETIGDIIESIFSIITMKGVTAWGHGLANSFKVPESITDASASAYNSLSAYTKTEYLDLCSLATVIKLVSPLNVLLDVCNKIYREDQVNDEHRMFEMLLDNSDLDLYPGMIKLRAQVNTAIGTQEVPTGLVSRGITNYGFATIILASKILRDLAGTETDVAMRSETVSNNIADKVCKTITEYRAKLSTQYGYRNKLSRNEREGGEGNTTHQEDVGGGERYSVQYPLAYKHELERFLELYADHKSALPFDKPIAAKFIKALKSSMPPTEGQRTVMMIMADRVVLGDGLQFGSSNSIKVIRGVLAAVAYKLELFSICHLMLAEEDLHGEEIHSQWEGVNANYTPALVTEVAGMYDEEPSWIKEKVDLLVKEMCGKYFRVLAPTGRDKRPELQENGSIWTFGYTIKDELLKTIIAVHGVNKA